MYVSCVIKDTEFYSFSSSVSFISRIPYRLSRTRVVLAFGFVYISCPLQLGFFRLLFNSTAALHGCLGGFDPVDCKRLSGRLFTKLTKVYQRYLRVRPVPKRGVGDVVTDILEVQRTRISVEEAVGERSDKLDQCRPNGVRGSAAAPSPPWSRRRLVA